MNALCPTGFKINEKDLYWRYDVENVLLDPNQMKPIFNDLGIYLRFLFLQSRVLGISFISQERGCFTSYEIFNISARDEKTFMISFSTNKNLSMETTFKVLELVKKHLQVRLNGVIENIFGPIKQMSNGTLIYVSKYLTINWKSHEHSL